MKHFSYICLFLLAFSSCSLRAVREAQDAVALADSCWQAGQPYADSMRLAQAYYRLGRWQNIYPTDYAHACYHYGRLLREKDNPVAAMECFINATHTNTHDYHILGRVYSNMGSVSHLADNYPLAYDMYERSAKMFFRNGDTLNYYYALNDMAFEKALLKETDSCFAILRFIENANCTGFNMTYCNLTRAQAYIKIQEYDSTVYYAQLARKELRDEPFVMLLLSQSYSYLGLRDSAVYYAKLVLNNSPTLEEQTNALYILTNDDDTKDMDGIRQAAADRSDAQKLLEIRQGEECQAVQILEQDLNRSIDWRWLVSMAGTLIAIGSIISIYVYRKRRKHALLSQKIEHLEVSYMDIQSNKASQIEQTCAILRASTTLQNDLSWKDFEKMCLFVNNHFYLLANKLKQKKVLNETEIRLCVLVLIGFSRSDIASTLPYALNSVGKLKDHTAKLLGTTGKNLHDYLIQMAINT